jgi:delta-1-pyrroline-5-carboxylate synthetase
MSRRARGSLLFARRCTIIHSLAYRFNLLASEHCGVTQLYGDRSRLLAEARRVVIKLGTAVLMKDGDGIAFSRFYSLVESIAALKKGGREVLVVSSGAVGLGAERLGIDGGSQTLELKQAAAAVGQGRLMTLYADAFGKLGVTAAQVLLTAEDFSDPRRYGNLRHTLDRLLELGALPIINENDTVSTTELEPLESGFRPVNFGDNDTLSALVAARTGADVLLILTDVDGLYTADPSGSAVARLIPVVDQITPELEAVAGGPRLGRGGMRSKIDAATIATRAGCTTIVAGGKLPTVIDRLFAGEELGTLILARPHAAPAAADVPDMGDTAARDAVVAAARRASLAARTLASLPAERKAAALHAVARALAANAPAIVQANRLDLEAARLLVEAGRMSAALLQRLALDDAKLQGLVAGIEQVADMEDPVGRVTLATELDDGLRLERVTCPIGVIGVVFESRPDALPQIVALCLKSGNAVLLKGGSEAERSNRALCAVIRDAVVASGIPADAITLLENREDVEALLEAHDYVDLIVPRGSNALVRHVQTHTSIPVLGHSEGICHVYVDRTADIDMALAIALDAKVQYPSACNAMETLLVHEEVAPRFLPRVVAALRASGVEVRCDRRALEEFGVVGAEATADDWCTEYGSLILSIRVVASLDEAIAHINRHGSRHTEAIVTGDASAFDRFFTEVDAAGVYLNASTRFADGFRYGFGAEVGISTGKLHPRGPVGIEGLVTYKYKLVGRGHVVGAYSGPQARHFTHRRLNQ